MSVRIAVAVNRSGKCLFDKALPNDENKFRALITDLKQHGQLLLLLTTGHSHRYVIRQDWRIEYVLVGYLLGLAMRHFVDLHAGEAQTDICDAIIIAEDAPTPLHDLRALKLAGEQIPWLAR